MSHYTLITHFDETSYKRLYSALDVISGEKTSCVPYGCMKDKYRYLCDTLPYHFTVSSSREPLSAVMDKLDTFVFKPFDIIIDDVKVMPCNQNSQLLYFSVKKCEEMDLLQAEIFKRFGNKKYEPGKCTIHLTICVSKKPEKIAILQEKLKKDFSPFTIRVTSLGLYEIWPGKLKAEYYSKQSLRK